MKNIDQIILEYRVRQVIDSIEKMLELETKKMQLYRELRIALILKDRPDLTIVETLKGELLFFDNKKDLYRYTQGWKTGAPVKKIYKGKNKNEKSK